MPQLTAHHLRFSLEVETTIELNEHKGSAMRGLLFHALRGPEKNPALGFCTQRHLKTCAECALVAVCPVASLVATLNPEAERGRDVPRPYAIKPPLDEPMQYEPGEHVNFGLTLFGHALNLFPYVVMGLRQAERSGFGKKLPRPEAGGRAQRGRFKLRSAQAINLLTGEVQDILAAGSSLVQRPNLPVTHAQVLETSRHMLSQPVPESANGSSAGPRLAAPKQGPIEISLVFKTPLRIIHQERLLKEPHFSPIFHRLLDRFLALNREFCQVGLPQGAVDETSFHAQSESHTQSGSYAQSGSATRDPKSGAEVPTEQTHSERNKLLALSDQVELVANHSGWQEVWSYSARQARPTPIGGLAGQARYRAPAEVWQELLPYLLWGSIIHVGKNAVKGDGWFNVEI